MWNLCRSTISCIMSQSEYYHYDLLRLLRAKKIRTISFYLVCCICIAINIVFSSHHLQEQEKKAKHEDIE